MKSDLLVAVVCVFLGLPVFGMAAEPPGEVILQDDFERKESDPAKEQIGNGWGTNSRTRAKGQKQVWLKDGAMYIERAEVADHGVSVTHDLLFRDATLKLRFKIGAGDDLGVNIADLQEKSVHAGHLCVARVRTGRLEIADLKTGRMKKEVRERRQAGQATAADQQLLKQTVNNFKVDVAKNEWHDLEIRIVTDMMKVLIDGKQVGQLQSEGIAHPTKRKLRLAVGKSAWVDDVTVIRSR